MSTSSPVDAARRRADGGLVGAEQSAAGMADDDDLVGAQERLADDERADDVVGRDAARVADDVRVADAQAERLLDVEPRIHAGDDRDAPERRRGQGRSIERLGIALVLGEDPREFADVAHSRVGSGQEPWPKSSVSQWSSGLPEVAAPRRTDAEPGASGGSEGAPAARLNGISCSPPRP